MQPPSDTTLCLHCEQVPATHYLGLCSACATVHGIRILYIKRRGWTPQWEEHLRRLSKRARQRLPLFPTGEQGAAPR